MYLTDSQMDNLISSAKALRVGHKLDAGWPAYIVMVDGGMHKFRDVGTLRKFLSDCYISPDTKAFRNFCKGVTINLDK